MLKVYPILCRAGKMDNYAYLLLDEATGISAVIDPSEAAPIIKKCAELGVKPDYILNTHHHFDHTDANEELKKLYNAKVVANINDAARIPGFDIGVEPGGTFALGESIAEIIDVSALTQGHILWYLPKDKIVFTGDTLFNLCVGGLFEGSVEEMYTALQKTKQLPDDVLFTRAMNIPCPPSRWRCISFPIHRFCRNISKMQDNGWRKTFLSPRLLWE